LNLEPIRNLSRSTIVHLGFVDLLVFRYLIGINSSRYSGELVQKAILVIGSITSWL
jgi:hypothetical protein